MTWLRRNFWELLCTIVLLPALVIAFWNADVLRLAAGAFGPPPGTFIVRWLGIGTVLIALALWRRSTAGSLLKARWLIALACVAVMAISLSLWRNRDIRTREVRFGGPDISIAGTLYEPASGGPFPAVVLVHGSAPLKRGFYGLWAERMARSGIAVLVPDKRGVGGTGGEFERENNTSRKNITLLAGDVVAAVDFAASQPDIDPKHIGLFGLSQAGWVAPMAATMTSKVRFLAMITCPTVSVYEEAVWSDWLGDDEKTGHVPRAKAEQMMDTVSNHGVDARTLLASLDVPGLWLFGEEDNSIPSAKSVQVLDSLNHGAGKHFSSNVYPSAGHLLITRRARLIPGVETASWVRLTEWLKAEVARP